MEVNVVNERWKLYQEKYRELFNYGVEHGLIRLYSDNLIKALRNIYYGGLPASIVLLCNEACNGFCYDRAILLSLAFFDDDYQMIEADIDSLRFNPHYIAENGEDQNPRYAEHCYLEGKGGDGTIWVFDTSLGLVFERGLYEKMQQPKVNRVYDKNTVMSFGEYQDIKNADIESDKYALPLLMPSYEAIAEKARPYYQERLKEEIDYYKKFIDYDGIEKEVHDDMLRKGFFS